MDRLLQYPPDQPLVHVDHSHRRVLAAPPNRQVVTRGGCVYNPSYDGDSGKLTCSVPVHGVYGRHIIDMDFDLDTIEDSALTEEVDFLTQLLEVRYAQFALVYYAKKESWESVIELHRGKVFDRYSVDLEGLRKYLANERDSEGFKIRLSNSGHGPSAPTLR